MRKGFFLTESEKDRISGLYNKNNNKLFLIEAVDPPKDADEVKAFQDWMDAKYPSGWATGRSGNLYVVGRNPSNGYGRYPMGAQTKLAWEDDAKGGEYRREKGLGTDGGDKKWRVWNEKDKKYEGPYTIEELKTKFSKNEISGETYVAHPDITGNQAMKAKNIKQLEMPGEPLAPSASTPSIDYQQVKGTEIKRPETGLDKYYKEEPGKKTIPGPEDLTYRQKTSQGFIEWAKKNLNTLFTDNDIVELKGNRIVTKDQYGTQRVYDYDDKSQEWKHPNFSTNIQIIAKPETDKQ